MIPQSRKWKVTFYKTDGKVISHVVQCVKRFAVGVAMEEVGYHSWDSKKITVGLVK